jgi:Flp pilus assembly protein TadB
MPRLYAWLAALGAALSLLLAAWRKGKTDERSKQQLAAEQAKTVAANARAVADVAAARGDAAEQLRKDWPRR